MVEKIECPTHNAGKFSTLVQSCKNQRFMILCRLNGGGSLNDSMVKTGHVSPMRYEFK